jgi:hypothetical protein
MAVIAEGVEERHARSCRTRERGRCNCKPSYQVTVYDGRAQKRIHKTFRSLTEAKAWRQDASVALRAGTLRASDGRTVMQVANQWLEDARAGLVRNRSGDVYKPSAIRSYERRGWDAIEGEIAPKSRTGVRKVPMPSTLREHLEGCGRRLNTGPPAPVEK